MGSLIGWTLSLRRLKKADSVFEAIEKLVEVNNLRPTFEAGRCFARLAHQAEEFDQAFGFFRMTLSEWDAPPFNELIEAWISRIDPIHSELITCLEDLAKLPVVQRCYHANSLIKHELLQRAEVGSFDQFAFWEQDDPQISRIPQYEEDVHALIGEISGYIERFSGSVASSWLAFGDVLATLRDIDAATLHRDKPLPSLRSYQLSGDSSVDKMRAALQLAEQELANESDASHHPENLIAAVAHGIEILARRLWPKDVPVDKTGRGKLVGVLHDRRKDESNELERRFANLALALYAGYRNPAIHDLDHFQCTWAEARFFVSGMRVLFDISEELARKSS